MSRAILIVAILGLIGSPALAASTVSYKAELGGDNHAAAWEAGNPQYFTPGSQTNGQIYNVGDTITWDVTVEASGVQSAPGTPSHGFPIQGVANMVFDVELHMGSPTGPLAANVNWSSTINDGDGGDAFENAEFTRTYNVGGNGPGRVVDAYGQGGPFMDYFQYPTSSSYPLPNTALPGKLYGMGAGYSHWGGAGDTTPGVGMTTLPNGQPGLGIVPVAEGQMGTTALAPGVYYLSVIPGSGNNVLRGDLDLSQSQGNFAVRANQTFGHDLMFVLVPEPTTALLLTVGLVVCTRRRQRAR